MDSEEHTYELRTIRECWGVPISVLHFSGSVQPSAPQEYCRGVKWPLLLSETVSNESELPRELKTAWHKCLRYI